MNTASLNRLTKVHPELAKRVAFLAQELGNHGHNVEVVQGLFIEIRSTVEAAREE